ncbi:hypothetical protein NBRC116591_34470 [Sessilibacter corallicola]|uniref:Integrase catalytic domain-containing protein n=1 Tax=Sessilibacter corallicola TaxID=2904075 RepID=A0ABQ0ADC6_9GAMM
MVAGWRKPRINGAYRINFENYVTMDQARASLFNYMESFYNRTRKHSSLNYLSPNDFEKLAG